MALPGSSTAPLTMCEPPDPNTLIPLLIPPEAGCESFLKDRRLPPVSYFPLNWERVSARFFRVRLYVGLAGVTTSVALFAVVWR